MLIYKIGRYTSRSNNYYFSKISPNTKLHAKARTQKKQSVNRIKNTQIMFNIVLFEPKIPQNTGNIIRLVANNGCHLHLIEPLGFNLEEKSLRRSGLDYKDLANITLHKNYTSFIQAMPNPKVWVITTKGSKSYDQVEYKSGDILLFGSETAGLPKDLQQTIPESHQLRIPMQPNNRSMNLSNTVALVSYEAWRQQSFAGGK